MPATTANFSIRLPHETKDKIGFEFLDGPITPKQEIFKGQRPEDLGSN